ncbi:MAG: hypothetical protein KGR26_05790 [Cyanobacteria bacterium REEB65]|nr:hypothetical protein [Cyanobacteria bacterium REEB65]
MRASCVSCHNAWPDSPKKDWKVGQVGGALEVAVPMQSEQAAVRQSLAGGLALLAGISLLWLTGVALAIIRLRRTAVDLERQVAERTAELTRSNRELERFAYVASHDLQEPLRAVSGFVSLLARRFKGKIDPEADEFITYAVDGATRMRTLINDLLTYSRAGTRPKALELTNCETIFEHALANLQPTIADTGASVVRGPLPTLMTDRVMLTQVFQNLIANALKFRSPDRKPEVRVEAVRRDDEWQFSIRDNGIGIEPQYFGRIFELFQRLHDPTRYPGTGLGLAICKKIVERYGGRIWVESQPGEGSTFFFTLPTS